METREVKITLAKALKLHDELFGSAQTEAILLVKCPLKTKYLLNKLGAQVTSEKQQYEDVRNKYIAENGKGEDGNKSIDLYETNPDKTIKLEANGQRTLTEIGKAYFKQMEELLASEVKLSIPIELTVQAIFDMEAKGDFSILCEVLEVA